MNQDSKSSQPKVNRYEAKREAVDLRTKKRVLYDDVKHPRYSGADSNAGGFPLALSLIGLGVGGLALAKTTGKMGGVVNTTPGPAGPPGPQGERGAIGPRGRGSAGDSNPIGSLIYALVNPDPDLYVPADGSEISRVVYQELFDVIGTEFGFGNGVSSFNLPKSILNTTGGTADNMLYKLPTDVASGKRRVTKMPRHIHHSQGVYTSSTLTYSIIMGKSTSGHDASLLRKATFLPYTAVTRSEGNNTPRHLIVQIVSLLQQGKTVVLRGESNSHNIDGVDLYGTELIILDGFIEGLGDWRQANRYVDSYYNPATVSGNGSQRHGTSDRDGNVVLPSRTGAYFTNNVLSAVSGGMYLEVTGSQLTGKEVFGYIRYK